MKHIPPIEQLGTYDPIPNEHGEKLCSLNLERIAFYIGKGVKISEDVSALLGKIQSFFLGVWDFILSKLTHWKTFITALFV